MKYALAFLILFKASGVVAVETMKSGGINFIAKGNPGFMKIEGKSQKGFTGELDTATQVSSGRFNFDLSAIETGIDLRDEHMKDKYLEVKKYPQASLEIRSLSGLDSLDGESSGTFKGMLLLHGVSQEVTGRFDLSKRLIRAKFSIKISDYKIDVPSWMGVTVADDVDVMVDAKF